MSKVKILFDRNIGRSRCLMALFIMFAIFNEVRAQRDEDKIFVGSRDSIHSKILNEERQLWVYVPNNGSNVHSTKQKYPVIYLLDAEVHFASLATMVERLSSTMVIPEMIIVGISNTNRFRDLTPTKPTFDESFPMPPFVGGGEAFTAFIERELFPYIASKYPVAPYRMMIGHSIGGLMVVNTLLHHSHMFNFYLSIDPSLWWDNELMVAQADSMLQANDLKGKSLFFAMANNNIPPGTDFSTILKDTTENSANSRPMLAFKEKVENHKNHDLQWKFQYYPDDSHGSVTLIAEYDAIRFAFNEYAIPLTYLYNVPDPAFQADSFITAHFKAVSEKMGYDVLPPESFVNDEAYNLMYNNSPERALKFFEMNIRNYPESSNAHDSMGDYYRAVNDKENAIRHYTKALELREVPATRTKLEELKKE